MSKALGTVVLAALSLAVGASTSAQAGTFPPGTGGATTCTRASFPVTLEGPLLATKNTIAGSLCGKNPANKQVLLITSHGATYNHRYWDWPQEPALYSFVRNQSARVSVLNIDLLGSGASSHPLSVHVTQQAQASMMHQLVGTMRTRGFKKIVLVGHSSGSGTIIREAATYHDVDGLIVTGFLHKFAPPPRGQLVPLAMYPAALDPAFAKSNLDPGYLTTRPGTRSTSDMFYHLSSANPDVMAYDDAHKDVVPFAHMAGFALIVNDSTISSAITVPVLSLVGNFDGGFCDSATCPQAADEADAWSASARLELHVIANAGHDIHLHRAAAPVEFAYIRAWLDRRFK